jgi:hypothetical protein
MFHSMTVLFLLGSLAPSAIATSTTNKIRTTLATKDRVHLQQSHVNYAKQHPSSVSSSAPPVSLSEWKGVADHEDIFQHVRPLIEQQDKERALHLKQVADGSAKDTSLVETGTGVGKVHAFCEICILIMQMKERGQPHLCAGLNPDYFVSVSSIVGCRHSVVVRRQSLTHLWFVFLCMCVCVFYVCG